MSLEDLPQIHPEASTGVFARHLLKNDRGSVFQTCPKPNRNKSGGEHSGDSFSFLMSLVEEASSPKGQGRGRTS